MVSINSIFIIKAASRYSRFFFWLFFCMATSTQAFSSQEYFLIQLGEYPVSAIEINKSLQNLLPLQVYVESKDHGMSWDLNLGFFASEAEARKIAQSLQNNYPQLLIRNINETQFKSIESNRKPPWEVPAPDKDLIVHVDSRAIINSQLERAAELYSKGDYPNAAILYQLLSHVPNDEQAAWALELYGVCQEKQRNYNSAIASYSAWLEMYPTNASQPRVQQRLLALNTAIAEPVAARKKTVKKKDDAIIYGSASMSYQGMRREVDGQDPETVINSVATNLDLNMRARTGNLLLKSRITGGYVGDYSDRQNSDGYVSNLNVTLLYEPSGAELTVGRLRSNDNGIFGYLDGAVFSYPLTENIAVNLAGGTVTTSTSESPDTDRLVYALGTDIQFDNPGWQVHLYVVEQTYEDITERRAVGTEISYFNDYSHYLLIADYDIKFGEANNLLFNGSWDVTTTTNFALSLGYQRSPFLTASNALIGEFDVDLNDLVDGLDQGTDIYDAALDKTALSQYASIVVNQQLSERLSLIAEVYYYDLSDLPVYDPNFDTPDSDASTTYGLQFLLAEALFNNYYLSTGIRYTDGDTSSSTSLFVDEKLRLNADVSMTLRLLATQRSINGLDQDAYTLRPGIRLDWYFTPTLLLDTEMGYEWLMQDFESGNYKVQQGYIVIGLHKRF